METFHQWTVSSWGILFGNMNRKDYFRGLVTLPIWSSTTIYTAKQRSMHCIGYAAFAIKPDQPVGYAP
ncbi:hypothetical protein SMB34_13920 [Thalassospira permensis NBRC 106175]|uniref:Uncharacterized protein n=1 Tax=Thalassospira permensis NBRC 106175 TaxID=1353532 RepID=A0ABR4TRK0_9PROT|nr:hypothetical protein SMB34_13920 [Thalassospira permensis NBRC 106175]